MGFVYSLTCPNCGTVQQVKFGNRQNDGSQIVWFCTTCNTGQAIFNTAKTDATGSLVDPNISDA